MCAAVYNNINLGYILKCGREDNDLSQKKVMEITGINNKTLSGYENNISEPDFNTLITLFRLYGISLDDLIFNGIGDPRHPLEKYKFIEELPSGVRDDLIVEARALYKKYCE